MPPRPRTRHQWNCGTSRGARLARVAAGAVTTGSCYASSAATTEGHGVPSMERVRRQLIVCPGTGTHRNASGALRANDVTNTLSLDLVAHSNARPCNTGKRQPHVAQVAGIVRAGCDCSPSCIIKNLLLQSGGYFSPCLRHYPGWHRLAARVEVAAPD